MFRRKRVFGMIALAFGAGIVLALLIPSYVLLFAAGFALIILGITCMC